MKLRPHIFFILLAVLVFVASLLVMWNSVRLQMEVHNRTERYVTDVTVQLTKDINNRISKIMEDLVSTSDSIIRIKEDSLETMYEFLDRKAEMLGFSAFVVADTNGRYYQSKTIVEDLFSLPGIQASLHGDNGVSFLEEQNILYSIPIYRESEVIGVMGGVRSRENMQALIQPDSFSGQSLTCIVNDEGEVIISPTDLSPFLQLDDIFHQEPDGEVAQEIYEMKINMKDQRSGIFLFDARDDSRLILSYNPLDSYGWVLLTLVSGDVISVKIDSYMNQTFLLMIATIALMLSILLALFFNQKSHYEQMEKAAFVDRVTGGMNNQAFQVKCESVLQNAAPNTYSVVLLNIKNFKFINAHFGSQQGDKILQKMMSILQSEVKGIGFAARAEGDLFFLCLKQGMPEQILHTVEGIMQKVDAKVRRFNRNREIPLVFVLQPGVYIIDDPGLDITIIQDRAKTASRNRADSEDGVCKFYDVALTKKIETEQILNGLFQKSLENHDFTVFLQPKVWTESGKVGGAEALVRWQHPQRGMIFPSDFIPLFEANGNICKLDLYMFEEVCKVFQKWKREGKELFPISVNLSRQNFRMPNALEKLAAIAKQYEVDAKLVEFELTESIFLDDDFAGTVKQGIKELHKLGFSCSLDDFGSGFSALGLLSELDIDAVKLDRRFFKDIENKKVKDLITSIVELARKLGARSIAEGIETPEQLRLIKETKCEMVQGYIYSKPLPVSEFEAWLKTRTD